MLNCFQINSTYGADASVPMVVQYVALNKLHSMYISSYMQVLDKQSGSSNKLSCSSLSKSQQKEFGSKLVGQLARGLAHAQI